MKQIKTIEEATAREFDEAVNQALREGWELIKRHIVCDLFIAELEKNEITEGERCCNNCKHCDKPPHVLPCKTCEDESNWEEG